MTIHEICSVASIYFVEVLEKLVYFSLSIDLLKVIKCFVTSAHYSDLGKTNDAAGDLMQGFGTHCDHYFLSAVAQSSMPKSRCSTALSLLLT